MQMCPFCDKVYDDSEYSHCPYCLGVLDDDDEKFVLVLSAVGAYTGTEKFGNAQTVLYRRRLKLDSHHGLNSSGEELCDFRR
jgi:Zn-finger nucleic acid-binding protein